MASFYLINELTNTAGQDGSSIAVYKDDNIDKAMNNAIIAYHQTLATYHNADDVLYANVMIHDEYGRVLGGEERGYKKTVDHKPVSTEEQP